MSIANQTAIELVLGLVLPALVTAVMILYLRVGKK